MNKEEKKKRKNSVLYSLNEEGSRVSVFCIIDCKEHIWCYFNYTNKEEAYKYNRKNYEEHKEERIRQNKEYYETHKRKDIYLFGMGEENAFIEVIISISSVGKSRSCLFNIKTSESKKKDKKYPIRHKDRDWCFRNIPSSIMWKIEIHHDWEKKGIMYLLDPKEHKKITRKEKNKNGKRKDSL